MSKNSMKQIRTTAKSRFTRIHGNLQGAIEKGFEASIVNARLTDLREAWLNVQEKHENYISFIYEDETFNQATEDDWISRLNDIFDETEDQVFSYIKKVNIQIKREEYDLVRLKALKLRKLEEAVFMTQAKHLSDMISPKDEAANASVNAIKEARLELKYQLLKCKDAHNNYVSLQEELTGEEIDWLNDLQSKFSSISLKASTIEHADSGGGLRLEKLKMPSFDGNIRNYARFKADFTRQVIPEMKNNYSAAYALKSCLSYLPLEVIKNVDDDLPEMWKRLDDKYGTGFKLTEVVMNDIKKFRPLKEGEDKRFIDLTDIVERGYRDLCRLNLEYEMINSTAISMIEDKLPRDIRRLWARNASKMSTASEPGNRFKALLLFLLEEKRAIEHDLCDFRNYKSIKGEGNHIAGAESEFRQSQHLISPKLPKCIIHQTGNHDLGECRVYMELAPEEKIQLLRNNNACYSCLKLGHRSADCKYRIKCKIDNCGKYHHESLHEFLVKGINFHTLGVKNSTYEGGSGSCLLQLMAIKSVNENLKPLTVFFDSGATISLITFKMAAMLDLQGHEVNVTVTKVGGKQEGMMSRKYNLELKDKEGKLVEFVVYGIEKISSNVGNFDLTQVLEKFDTVSIHDVKRPCGEVDVLIGLEYAGYHPVRYASEGHLLLLKNRFGNCLGGFDESLREKTCKVVKHVTVHHLRKVKIDDFFNSEAMGVTCTPLCGGCKCGNCPIGGKDYSLKEERELRLIENGLFHLGDHWTATYPWIKDPSHLPNNKVAAYSMLQSLEKRLMKNKATADLYKNQIYDMLSRGVARKLKKEEIIDYVGPVYYVGHHEVLKPSSFTTPCRIVFNTSASFKGHVLNEYWAKGPDLINNLLGILIRFREGCTAITGDIRKMYHAVKISEKDQHTHRFLWRDMKLNNEPETYVMNSVSFGDKPAGNIATLALRKTAEMGKHIHPEAAEVILKSTYVDDIIDSFNDISVAEGVTKSIDEILKLGGFQIKQWKILKLDNKVSNENSHETGKDEYKFSLGNQKVLGVHWDHNQDAFKFEIHLNFSPKIRGQKGGIDLIKEQLPAAIPMMLTKRMLLSQINGIYDPMGLASPFTVKAKILMRKLYTGNAKLLGWDEDIPNEYWKEWVEFFTDMFDIQSISFPRCLKPNNAIGDPTLILFSDGSNDAYGACAYARWETKDGLFKSKLIASKNRITPLKRITTVRSELNGALILTRLKNFIEKESRLNFLKHYYIIDSEIVKAMIKKESYGFNTYVAVRIGEIQESTDYNNWYCIDGKLNVADWLTRGKAASEIDIESCWQVGPDFLSAEVKDWPLKITPDNVEVPEQLKSVMVIDKTVVDTLAMRINIDRFSTYSRLIRVTARVLLMYNRGGGCSFKKVSSTIKPTDLEKAHIFWVKEVQTTMKEDIKSGRYKRLVPIVRNDGIIIVSGRTVRLMQIDYDHKDLVLLPYNHYFSELLAISIHNEGHLGVSATACKIRSQVWISNLMKMVKRIKSKCTTCKRADKKLQEQRMAPLPIERLIPAPPWNSTGVDYFGPIEIRGEVNKRSRGKVYGVLFNCSATRAVHVDIASGYSMEDFLMVMRRFVSLRGYPQKLRSDNGTQLVATSKELRSVIEGFNKDELVKFGVEKGLEWIFPPADAPWYQGCSESLIKSIKRAIMLSIGNQILTFAELQTVCFETSNLVNERPIGIHSVSHDDEIYLSPNHILLGRASNRVPSGPFREQTNIKQRFELVQQIIDTFWAKWTRQYFPCLLVEQKWHVEKRNVKVGDIAIVQDLNKIRGNWKLCRVTQVFPSEDNIVRKVELEYTISKESDSVRKHNGSQRILVMRAVQRLVIILPIEDQLKN